MNKMSFFLTMLLSTAPYAVFPWLYPLREEINAWFYTFMMQMVVVRAIMKPYVNPYNLPDDML